MSINLKRVTIFIVFLYLLLTIIGCQPPDISAYVLGRSNNAIEEGRWIHLESGKTYKLQTLYRIDSLNQRLEAAHHVEVYNHNLQLVSSPTVNLTEDSLEYTTESGVVRIAQKEVRQLIIYNSSRLKRSLQRGGCLAGILGGLASLAYIPPNPPNEPPVSTVFIMGGSGALLGFTLDDIPVDREIVAFFNDDEVPW